MTVFLGKTERLVQGTQPHRPDTDLAITTSNRGDGSALSFKANAAETRHLVRFGVKLAELINDRYHTEHILHVFHCFVAVMDF